MTYEQQQYQLNEKIKAVQQVPRPYCYIQDGIVDIEKWRTQVLRPLFIGKEARHDEKPEWSIIDWLKNESDKACNASPATWQTMVKVSYALQNGLLNHAELPSIRGDNGKMINALQNIAFINVGKCGGEKNTPRKLLYSLYNQNKHVLHDQITLYQPNIVVGWNTLYCFENDHHFTSRFGAVGSKTKYDVVDSWVANGILYIDAYHPAYYRITREDYVNGIMDAVNAHYAAIDKQLPTW